MYLSVDGKYFVHHQELEKTTERQDRITVYELKETDIEITFPSNKRTEEKKKIEKIDTDMPKTFPVYPFRNFSNNKNIQSMKKIFISYSRKDVGYKDELKNHLNMLRIFDIADNWSCDQITIEKWHDRIQKELEESDLIIYMLSANFFSSSYILDEEVKKGLYLANDNDSTKKILCVIVSDFVDLNDLKKVLENNNMPKAAALQLSEYQYLPYGKTDNKVTSNDEEKIISLKRYRNMNNIEEALTQITKKVLEVLS
jgi:internalin A